MSHTRAGIILGVVLAFATIFGGWAGLLWAVLFGTLGGVVGAHLDGTLDLRSLLRGRE